MTCQRRPCWFTSQKSYQIFTQNFGNQESSREYSLVRSKTHSHVFVHLNPLPLAEKMNRKASSLLILKWRQNETKTELADISTLQILSLRDISALYFRIVLCYPNLNIKLQDGASWFIFYFLFYNSKVVMVFGVILFLLKNHYVIILFKLILILPIFCITCHSYFI